MTNYSEMTRISFRRIGDYSGNIRDSSGIIRSIKYRDRHPKSNLQPGPIPQPVSFFVRSNRFRYICRHLTLLYSMEKELSIAKRIKKLQPKESVSFPIMHLPSVRTRIWEIKQYFPDRVLVSDTTTSPGYITITRTK